MSGVDIIDRLRRCRESVLAGQEESTTLRRYALAFGLIDDLQDIPRTVLGEGDTGPIRLAEVVKVAGAADPFGSIIGYNEELKSVSVVLLRTGDVMENLSSNDIISVPSLTDDKFDYISRIVWQNALSESRIPLMGTQIKGDCCPWPEFELAYHLTDSWSEELWRKPPGLLMQGCFSNWLYLYAEGLRGNILGQPLFAMRCIEECRKQLEDIERNIMSSDFLHETDTTMQELALFISYHPQAVRVIGKVRDGQADGINGAFSLMRHMLSTSAVKIIRAIFRKPNQMDFGRDVTIDKMILLKRIEFYICMQRTAENELRVRSCSDIMGDGQGDWNMGWLCSVQTNPVAVCVALRRGMTNASLYNNNAFAAAKTRWDLAGYIIMGGEGKTYDLSTIRRLSKEAKDYEEDVNKLGMGMFIDGECFCKDLVKRTLANYEHTFNRTLEAINLRGNVDQPVCAASGCKNTQNLQLCGRCKRVRYCSRECQVKHHKLHKNPCKANAV